MKKTTICLLLLLCIFCVSEAEVVINQGFETGDSWNYTSEPQPYREIWWGPRNQDVGGALAHTGQWYWASWDVDSQLHSLTFDSIELNVEYTYTLGFYYYSRNLTGSIDTYRYCLEFDDGSAWNNWQEFELNTNAWTEVRMTVPGYASHVRLKLETQYNGINKYLHWDSFELSRVPAVLYPPLVSNINATQRSDGSKLVDITYNLEDRNLNSCEITPLISLDGGASFAYQPQSELLSGDRGENVLPGIGKHIIWDAGAEAIDFVGDQYRVKIIAEDHADWGVLAEPVISPDGGNYHTCPEVSLSSLIPGASIFYTLDDSDPTQSSTLYTGPITLQSSATIKARAFMDDLFPSEISTAVFHLAPVNLEQFVYVPSGTFTMGRTVGEGNDNELPTHTVSLNGFFIGKYEVTQAEYIFLMGNVSDLSNGNGPNHPIYKVSWYSMLKYCNLRSLLENLQPVYTINGSTNPLAWGIVPTTDNATWNAVICNWEADGYRLPTEAEWEYAARGATNDPDYLFSGSDDAGEVGWYQGNAYSTTHPVGQKLPNGLGIYDMTGNIMEWLWDWMGSDYYSNSPIDSPTGPETGLYHVGRGGNWTLPLMSNRMSYRSCAAAQYRHNNYGFRLCRKAYAE